MKQKLLYMGQLNILLKMEFQKMNCLSDAQESAHLIM